MKVFLSWSGTRSEETAKVLADWLKEVIQVVDPWISSSGIPKGKHGIEKILKELEESKAGIFCLNRDNLNARWILFEAGALIRTYVCTFLLDIKPKDIEAPLNIFQHTVFTREDVLGLVRTLNHVVKEAGERPLNEKRLDSIFETNWPELEEQLKDIVKKGTETAKPIRTERAKTKELDLDIRTLVADLLDITTLELKDRLAEYRSKKEKSEVKAALTIQGAREIIADKGLLKETVIKYYPASELKEEGLNQYSFSVGNTRVNTAIATKPEWTGLNTPLDGKHMVSHLVQDDSHVIDVPEELVLQLLSSREDKKIELWEGPIYRLQNVDFQQDRINASFAVDSFIHQRFSYGLVIEELNNALYKKKCSIESVLSDTDGLLPLRKTVLPDAASLINFNQRICAGGITMVFAIPRPEPSYDFVFPIQQRSKIVADGPGMYTIVPRGHHQSMRSANKEVAPSVSAYRELFEELFGGKEVEKDVTKLQHNWFCREETAMKWFYDNPKSFDLECTCFGIDMVSGNYQFGMLLVIHDESYCDNWYSKMDENWESAKLDRNFVSSKKPVSLAQLIRNPNWTGEGLITLIEGLKRLSAMDPQRVKMPSLRF